MKHFIVAAVACLGMFVLVPNAEAVGRNYVSKAREHCHKIKITPAHKHQEVKKCACHGPCKCPTDNNCLPNEITFDGTTTKVGYSVGTRLLIIDVYTKDCKDSFKRHILEYNPDVKQFWFQSENGALVIDCGDKRLYYMNHNINKMAVGDKVVESKCYIYHHNSH